MREPLSKVGLVLTSGDRFNKLELDSAGTRGITLFRRVALLFGSLHLTLMAALGIWLWSKPQTFGKADSTCTIEFANLAILGARVPFGSNALRIFSLAFYSAFLLPGFNLFLPMLLFLSIFICHHHYQPDEAPPTPVPSRLPSRFRRGTSESKYPSTRTRRLHSSAFPVWVGLAFLLVINIVFIVDIELTLHRNRDLQAQGEAEWGFGQVLAVLLLFMPLRDLVEMIVARRQKLITAHEWREAILLRNTGKIHALVKAGVDPNVRAGGQPVASEAVSFDVLTSLSDNSTALTVVAQAGHADCLQTLIRAGVDIEAKSSGTSPHHSLFAVEHKHGSQTAAPPSRW